MSDTFLTIKEAAKLLDVHWQTIRNYIEDDKLDSIKIGRSVRIPRKSIESFTNESKPKNLHELEERFIITDVENIDLRLKEISARLTSHSHIIDHYYCPNDISNMKEKDKFYDSPTGYGTRIREIDFDYTGNIMTSLEVKKVAGPDYTDHSNCYEEEITISSYNQMNAVLLMMDMKEFLTIDKERSVYKLDDVTFCLDNFIDWGTGLEIEIKTEKANLEKSRLRIRDIAKSLGLNEGDKANRSFTYMMMFDIAKF